MRDLGFRNAPDRLNLLLAFGLAGANLWLYLGAPVLARTHQVWLWTAAPAVLFTQTLWAVLHEAFHGGLVRNARVNEGLGRFLAILFGASFRLLRFGHLVHHAVNGRPGDRWDTYDPDRGRPAVAKVAYYVRLLCGLYLSEAGSCLLALMPRFLLERVVRRAFYEGQSGTDGTAERAVRHLLRPSALAELRLDGAIVLLLLAVSFRLYGALWPALAAALGVRALIISLFDNAFHYGAPLGESRQGYNARPPLGLSILLLNANYHGVHHNAPDLTWRDLPRRFASDGRRYDQSVLACLARQFAGPAPR